MSGSDGTTIVDVLLSARASSSIGRQGLLSDQRSTHLPMTSAIIGANGLRASTSPSIDARPHEDFNADICRS